MTILITGASGAVGLPTIHQLVKRGAKVRAFTSNETSAAKLRSLGVAETAIGDFGRDDDVARAVSGATAVMHISPRFRPDEADIGLRVLKAAVAEKVEHFVFNSVFHSQMRDMDHHFNKLIIEEALIDSGLQFTIIQPASFMQNLRADLASMRKDGVFKRPYSPDQKMALLDTDDLGEVAAKILTEPGYTGAIFELCGPDRLTNAEMAVILSEVSGTPIRAERQTLDDWASTAASRGWKPWSIEAYQKMCRHYDEHGFAGGNPLVLKAILGRAPTSFREFARKLFAPAA